MEQQPSTSVVHSKRQTLRANPTQTEVLQEAYTRSSTVNNEIATELHQKTGLPPKWITQWFARRRSKERKKATTSARGMLDPSTSRGLLTSSSDVGYSPSDTFQVKLEDRDNILPSKSSSSFTPVGTTESSHIINGSGLTPQYMPDNPTSSSATVTRGRKRKQITVNSDIPPPPPRKRGRKRNDYSTGPLQLTQVKQEITEIPGSMDNRNGLPAELGVPAHTVTFHDALTTETPVLADPGVAARPSSIHPVQNNGTALHHTGFQIAPPKRSLKTPHRPRSNMATNDPSSVVNFTSSRKTFNSADATIEYHSAQHAGIISDATASTGIYQRAPIFRMGFQNSGPDNFAVTSETTHRGCPDTPASKSLVASTSQTGPHLGLPVLGMPFSLQHGTDSPPFRNADASECSYAAFYDIRTTQTRNLQAWPSAFTVNNEAPQFDLSVGLACCRKLPLLIKLLPYRQLTLTCPTPVYFQPHTSYSPMI
ncbi:hypothetical protein BJ165DRAFT_1610832 [Panaeolus papilionaceus]|nr:hypothetical protein BJ165DRAFT_1610832 [Panaeolus papilionaceus]